MNCLVFVTLDLGNVGKMVGYEKAIRWLQQ